MPGKGWGEEGFPPRGFPWPHEKHPLPRPVREKGTGRGVFAWVCACRVGVGPGFLSAPESQGCQGSSSNQEITSPRLPAAAENTLSPSPTSFSWSSPENGFGGCSQGSGAAPIYVAVQFPKMVKGLAGRWSSQGVFVKLTLTQHLLANRHCVQCRLLSPNPACSAHCSCPHRTRSTPPPQTSTAWDHSKC